MSTPQPVPGLKNGKPRRVGSGLGPRIIGVPLGGGCLEGAFAAEAQVLFSPEETGRGTEWGARDARLLGYTRN